MSDWQAVGPHRYRLEGGTLNWQPHGSLSVEHAHALEQLALNMYREHGYVELLFDARYGSGPTPAARQAMTQFLKDHNSHMQIAVFGQNLAMRSIMMLVCNAIRIVSGIPMQISFFDTEISAHAWLKSRRAP